MGQAIKDSQGGDKLRILIVEDCHFVSDVLRRVLSRHFYIKVCTMPMEVAVIWEKAIFDVLLVSNSFKEETITGIDLIKAIESCSHTKKRMPHLRTLLMVHVPTSDVPENVSCLIKPFNPEEVVALVTG